MSPFTTLKDLTGQRFGKLTVIDRMESDKHGHARWRCRCDCGNYKVVFATNLMRGFTVSCGCLNKESTAKGREKQRNIAHAYDTNIGKIENTEKPNKNNKLGIRGVCYIKSLKYYKAYIGFKKKMYQLCLSPDLEKCIKARKEAEEHLYKDFLDWYYGRNNKD